MRFYNGELLRGQFVRFVQDSLRDADFADIFEVRGVTRERKGQKSPPEYTNDTFILNYQGLDDVNRQTHIRLTPAPDMMAANKASYSFLLPVRHETNARCPKKTRAAGP